MEMEIRDLSREFDVRYREEATESNSDLIVHCVEYFAMIILIV